MLTQYRILTSCLSELKSSEMPPIEKLKLEVQLIQTKRILLDREVQQRISGDECSESEFRDLYSLVCSACNSCDANVRTSGVSAYIENITDGLKYKIISAPKAVENKITTLIVRKIFNNGYF
jgi:hypothetical protein